MTAKINVLRGGEGIEFEQRLVKRKNLPFHRAYLYSVHWQKKIVTKIILSDEGHSLSHSVFPAFLIRIFNFQKTLFRIEKASAATMSFVAT